MASFKDTEGREWTIRFTARRLTQLREMLGYSVSIVSTPDGLAEWRGPEVAYNPDKFGDVLALLLGDQFEKAKVTREQFEDAFDEEVYRKAGTAFQDALLGFSLVPDALRKVFAAGDETRTRPPSSISSNGVTNSPDVPGSTPATTA
jgi:hypothetical protein